MAFTEELVEAGIAGSIGTVGDALDNALMESTIGLYKTELIVPYSVGTNWSGLREVERETAEWVRWYNHERIHSSIDYLTPIEREVMYTDTIAQRARWPEPQPLANPGRFTTAATFRTPAPPARAANAAPITDTASARLSLNPPLIDLVRIACSTLLPSHQPR